MAWNDLASNQMVSFTDAQGGGFTLQPGQSNVTSNQCMTKNDALNKYVLDSSAMASYASNQLVPKSTWVGSGQGSLTFYFTEVDPPFGNAYLYVNGVLVKSFSSTGNFYTTLNVGDTFYAVVTAVFGGTILRSTITITSSTRGSLYSNTITGNQVSSTFTRQSNENIVIGTSTFF